MKVTTFAFTVASTHAGGSTDFPMSAGITNEMFSPVLPVRQPTRRSPRLPAHHGFLQKTGGPAHARSLHETSSNRPKNATAKGYPFQGHLGTNNTDQAPMN